MAKPQPFFIQMRSLVIIPTLQALAVAEPRLDTPAARNLLLGTAAQETGGRYLAQFPTGPGSGFWEIEPATAHDLQANFIDRRPALKAVVATLLETAFPADAQLISNLNYSCAMARLFYFRIPEALPAATDLQGLARYWKTYFNTAAGAGTTDEFVANFKNLIGDPPDV